MKRLPESSVPTLIALPTGLPVGAVNVYFFPEPVPTLIDTGLKSNESLAALKKGLSALGFSLRDLQRVVISHPHVDHFGMAADIVAENDAELLVFEPTIPILVDFSQAWRQRGDYYLNVLFQKLNLSDETTNPIAEYYRTVEPVAASLPAERIVPVRAGEWLQLGDRRWQVLYTPGHSGHLTCYYQPETRQFISTDMLLAQTPTPIIEPPADRSTEYEPSLAQFLDSLAKIDSLAIDVTYPGHGEIFYDAHDLIARQRDRIRRRKEECLAHVRAGISTVEPILLKMYPHYPPQFRFAALWMLVGYLDLLRAENEIIRVERAGHWEYLPVDGYRENLKL